jgi:hypothetical protein
MNFGFQIMFIYVNTKFIYVYLIHVLLIAVRNITVYMEKYVIVTIIIIIMIKQSASLGR